MWHLSLESATVLSLDKEQKKKTAIRLEKQESIRNNVCYVVKRKKWQFMEKRITMKPYLSSYIHLFLSVLLNFDVLFKIGSSLDTFFTNVMVKYAVI